MIFETHAHYDDERFDEDREELLASMEGGGVGRIITVAAAMADLPRAKALAEKYPFIYCTAGVHPEEIGELDEAAYATVAAYADYEKCVAIGEIGLDYYWTKENKAEQIVSFTRMIGLAEQKKLPVIVHSRDAAEDTLNIAKAAKLGDIGGVIHCFSYSVEMAREFLDLGLYLGIGGVVTFKNAKNVKKAVEFAPLDRLLLETDCPYMAPEPYRGKRNCSLYIPYVAAEIARIKGITPEEVISVTEANAKTLFCVS